MSTGKMHAHQKSFEWFHRPTIPVEEGVSVQESVNDYLQTVHVKYLRPCTQEEYLKELQHFAQWCAQHTVIQDPITKRWSASTGETMLHQVNDQVVYLFVQHLKMTLKPANHVHTTISTYTLAGHVRVIKTFLNWCFFDERYTQHIDFVAIQRIKKPPVVDIIPEIFSPEQISALFAACDKEESEYLQIRDRAILAVFLDTGIRVTELVTLQLGNVYLDPSSNAHIKVLGKGGKWGEVGLGEKARGYLQKYISTFRDPAIDRDVANISDKRRKQAIRQQAYVFLNRRGKSMTKSGLWRMFQRLGDWAQIDLDKCSPHVFRFTFAVNFIEQGGDIYRLSKLLRHSSFDVTEWYLRSIPQSEARKGAKSVLDNL